MNRDLGYLGVREKSCIATMLATSGIFILFMMIFGLLMLLSQGNVISIDDKFFYEIMTLHGTGLIGISALAGSAVMWFFLKQYVRLSAGILMTHFVFFMIGVSMVLLSVVKYHFAGGWTFLYPLPAKSVGVWGTTGAAFYLGGMLLIGVGFLLLYLDVARAIMARYGGLGKALGWPQLFGNKGEYGPPPTVVASTMVTIVNVTAIIAGAAILVMSMINVYQPSFTIDPLLAKNLTFAFGHIFANSIIYMGVIAVYEILPRYTNRPWKSNKVFLIAWNMSTLFTIIIYPHHLLMDFVMPKWMLVIGQVVSHANGLPVLVVTAYGALMIIYRSGIRWDMASGMMILAMFGWVAGVIPAIIDATIVVNYIMHNTQWVPGHFHMYMGLGAVAMLFGFMYYLRKIDGNRVDNLFDRISFWIYTVFFLGLCATFLFKGKISAPRRWSQHLPEWTAPNVWGAIFSLFVILAVFYFVYRFLHYALSVGVKQPKKISSKFDA
jgi:cytochrome c oxidase subunit 1